MKIRFADNDNNFYSDLKTEVNHYFEANNISPKANWQMYSKTAIILLFTFATYGVIISGLLTTWWEYGIALFLLGVSFAGIGLNIQHDANHNAYSDNKWVNKILGQTISLIGSSRLIWNIRHNLLHHNYTNYSKLDDDQTKAYHLRISPQIKHHWYHHLQLLTAIPSYFMYTIAMVFLYDFAHFFRYNGLYGSGRGKKHTFGDYLDFFFWKSFHLTYCLLIPTILLPYSFIYILLGYIFMHLIAGVILINIFQLAHVVNDTDHFEPGADGLIPQSWAKVQLLTSVSFARKNRILNWYLGGLNFQAEHHLLPHICHIHYTSIAPILEKVAKKHNLQYRYYDTFFAALYSHVKYMIRMAKGDRSNQGVPRKA